MDNLVAAVVIVVAVVEVTIIAVVGLAPLRSKVQHRSR